MTPVKLNHFPLNTLLDNFFNVGFDDAPTRRRAHAHRPAVNISETDDAFNIDVAAPGMEKGDFDLKVEKDTLTVSAKREVEQAKEGTTWKRREFSFKSFERSFVLPETVDAEAIKANYTNGILSVALPKKPEAKPLVKSIEVA